MKDERKIYWIMLLLAASMILFAIKSQAQSGKFSYLVLKDQNGEEVRKEHSEIKLLPDRLVITENGMKFQEKILLQSKSGDTCEVYTDAGRYWLVFEGKELKKAYLRSNVGADRIYLSDLAEIFWPTTKN